ncbi:PAS domain S-box protein [Methanobacterium sp.]|uniref:PAS domain S-box protein n=1 Tax=Methanobacterium sp. TaxID=2164 RepID=UPI003C72655D
MKNAKILIIEDENSATMSIKSKLEGLDYTVLAIESHGIKTIKDSGELKPDLILMDISQIGNYIEISRKIREYFYNPIVYLIDHSDSHQLENAYLTEPPVYVIRKQFSDCELKSTIETALYNYFKLKESDKNLNAFLNAVNEPAFLIDLNGNILFTNEYTEKTLGKVVGSNIYGLLSPHIATYRKKYVEMAIKTKKITYFEDERYGKSYEYRIYPILDEKDEVSKLSVIGLDVTERKIAENALKESEEKYRSIFENSMDAIFLTRPDGSILDANPAAEEMYGYTKDELCKLGRSGILDLNDPRLHEALNERVHTGKFRSEYNSIRNNGSKFVTDVAGNLFKDNKGNDKGIIITRDITERKKIEDELKENQRTLETLISNLPGVVYRCSNDPNWTMEFVSEGCLELTGYQPEDLIMNKNVSYENLINLEDRQAVWDVIQKALAEKKPFKITYRIITADLKEKYVWEQGRGIFSPEGKLVALEGFITDITKRKEAEKALQKSELYYRTIFENTGTATLIAGEDTVISLANTECEKLSGCSKEEIEGKKSWIDFIVEEDMERLLNYHNIRETDPRAPKNYELKLRNKQGDIKDVYVTIELIPYTRNRVISLLDITDKKRSRKALRESEVKFREIFNNANDMITVSELDENMMPGQFIEVNNVALEMLDYNKEEFLNMTPFDIVHPDVEASLSKIEYEMSRNGYTRHESILVTKNGSKIPVEVATHFFKLQGKEVVLAISRDITDRKKAEETLRLASTYNRSLIEASLDPLVTIGSDGKITDVNNSTEIITGYSREQLIGTDFSDYFTEPEKARKGYQQVFQEGLVRDYPLEIKNREGSVTSVLYNASVYKDEYGNVIGVFAAARDVTELKKAEENIKSSLEEKEILLREIHHRVKNNLQIIISLLSLQKRYIKDNETRNILEESQNRVKSMAMVHEKLYNSESLVKIDFKEYIKDLTDSLFLTYKISPYVVKLNKKIDNIFFDVNTAIPCGLIINELVTNSLKHAFPQTTDPESKNNEIQIKLLQSQNNFVLIVSDNGLGLPENIDFKSTESLGLRLVNSLVRQLDGDIKIDRTEGTKFKIIFKELTYKERI